MPRIISPDDFEIWYCGTVLVPGRTILKMFEFNPDVCEIKILKNGSLEITQKGMSSSFGAAPGFWTEIKPPCPTEKT